MKVPELRWQATVEPDSQMQAGCQANGYGQELKVMARHQNSPASRKSHRYGHFKLTPMCPGWSRE